MKKLFFALFVSLSILISNISYAKIDRFAEVDPGIYRGAQPEVVSDYQILQRLGVKTIIDVRKDSTVNDERKIAERMGFDFISIPIDGFFGAPMSYFHRAVDLISDPAYQPVFIHCQLGHDRTGVIVGLYRVHKEHWSPAQAYGEMLNFGYNFLLPGLDYAFWSDLKDAGFSKEELDLAKSLK